MKLGTAALLQQESQSWQPGGELLQLRLRFPQVHQWRASSYVSVAIGESLEGKPVQANTAFVSQAGQGDKTFCAKHPVGGPISFPSGVPGGNQDNKLWIEEVRQKALPDRAASIGLPTQAPNNRRPQSAIGSTAVHP
jgi:hypothetical protein